MYYSTKKLKKKPACRAMKTFTDPAGLGETNNLFSLALFSSPQYIQTSCHM
jgi:hypothetical protein